MRSSFLAADQWTDAFCLCKHFSCKAFSGINENKLVFVLGENTNALLTRAIHHKLFETIERKEPPMGVLVNEGVESHQNQLHHPVCM